MVQVAFIVFITTYVLMYIRIVITVIGQVTGVRLTCELLSLFDHYCTLMWDVIRVCMYMCIYTHTVYVYALMKLVVKYTPTEVYTVTDNIDL